jgi:hypothetical protein
MMLRKNGKKKVGFFIMIVTSCFVLTAIWAVLAKPETALAAKKADPVYFDVMTIVGSAMEITNPADVEGRYDGVGGTQVVVNRPAVEMKMDFLTTLDDFIAGDIYSGTLVIQQDKGIGHAVFFFKGPGKNWVEGDKLTGYRIDADAEILGTDFPVGEPVGGGYIVNLTNIELSVDTGSRKNGHEGSFPGAVATVQLDRIL